MLLAEVSLIVNGLVADEAIVGIDIALVSSSGYQAHASFNLVLVLSVLTVLTYP